MAKIIIIEDEPTVRDLLEEILIGEKYQVLTAGNGAEGLELFYQEQPDLVLLDLQMPVMNGYEFLEHVKPTPESSFLVIILTGCDNDDNLRKCFELGAGVFIRKPLVVEEIKRVVNKAYKLFKEKK